MGLTGSKTDGGYPQNTNFMSSGISMYTNEKGETVTDSFRHINGEFVRQTETGKLPASGGFISQSTYVPWMVATVATVFLVFSIFIFYSKQQTQSRRKRSTNAEAEVETTAHSIPLYSLNKQKSQYHPSDAMWNIDLLNDVE